MGKIKNVKEGDVFNKLTIIEEIEPQYYPSGTKKRKFKCKCECGNEIDVILKNTESINITSTIYTN